MVRHFVHFESTSVHLVHFGPSWSTLVYFDPIWLNLIHYGPLRSIWSIQSNFILFGPILSIQSTSVFFIYFSLNRSIQSNLVQFNLFKSIQTTLVHLKNEKTRIRVESTINYWVISIIIYMISFDYHDNLKRMRNLKYKNFNYTKIN